MTTLKPETIAYLKARAGLAAARPRQPLLDLWHFKAGTKDMTSVKANPHLHVVKGAGLAARRGSRTTLRGSRQRQPYMGRARLYANRRVAKDLTAGDVHTTSALGSERSRRRKKYPPLSFAYGTTNERH